MQKIFKKLVAAAMALAMLVGTAAPAMAAEGQKTEHVTVHKLLMSKAELGAWDSDALEAKGYDGTQDLKGLQELVGEGQTLKQIPDVYFAWQNSEGKWIDENGNVVDSVDKAMGGLTTADGIEFTTTNLPQDKATKYKIVEVKEKSTYVGEGGELLAEQKAVPVEITLPLVNNDGVQTDVHVYPKNTEDKPKVDKDFTEELGGKVDANNDRKEETNNVDPKDLTVGSKVPYEIETLIPAKSQYQTAAWTDQMTEGLTFNNDVKIFIGAKGAETPLAEGDYTLATYGNGFSLDLTKSGLEKINNQDSETRIHITYSATLDEDALVARPERNDVEFHYGNNPTHSNSPIPTKPNQENGELTVTKNFPGVEGGWVEGETVDVTLYDAHTNKPVTTDKDGNKIESTVTLDKDHQSYTWGNLDKNREYKVVEKFNPTDEVTYKEGEDGQVIIENKKLENPNPKPLTPEEPSVVTGGHRFQKTDQDGKGLAGAEFVVKDVNGKYLVEKSNETKAFEQAEYDKAEKAYKDAVANATTENPDKDNIKDLKAKRDAAYAKVNTQWEFTGENKEAGYKFIADANGYFKVTGLAYGNYELEETKAPKDYAMLNGTVPFEVVADSMGETEIGTNKDAGLKQIENKKVSIPQTGGIGTMIFTIVGIALMAGAYVAMKKNKKEELA